MQFTTEHVAYWAVNIIGKWFLMTVSQIYTRQFQLMLSGLRVKYTIERDSHHRAGSLHVCCLQQHCVGSAPRTRIRQVWKGEGGHLH